MQGRTGRGGGRAGGVSRAGGVRGAPLARPGFVAAAFGVALLVVAGAVVSILGAFGPRGSGGEADARSESQPPAAAAEAGVVPSADAGAVDGAVMPSGCGLAEPSAESASDPASWRLAIAPETSWRVVDVNLAPSSASVGPGAVDGSGFVYCYQRSAEGALFAAANFLVQSNTPGLRGPLLDYTLAPGEHREALLVDRDATADGVRLQLVGYRMLAFDGASARVDVAQRVTVDGATNFIAAVVDLEWVDGDWRIPTEDAHPVRLQALGDVGGYVRWGA